MTELITSYKDFLEKIIKPMADKGDVAAKVMLEAQDLIEKGELTAEKVKELARKAVPD